MKGQLRALEPVSAPVPSGHLHLAKIVAVSADGAVSLRLAGQSQALVARILVSVSLEQLQRAMQVDAQAVVSFEAADATRPIVLGIVAPLAEPALEQPTQQTPIEADVDGRRIRIVGKDEIVLECGKASITLRRNGKVIVRGTHVESYSEGTNRIKGGQVRIN